MYNGKYIGLYLHLLSKRQEGEQEITLRVSEIEIILKFSLPDSAYKYPAWWANEAEGTHSHAKSWLLAGWKTRNVKVGDETTFAIA